MIKLDDICTSDTEILQPKRFKSLGLTQSLDYYNLVNCEWRDWKIGECSQTCGGGTRANIRDHDIEAAFGGMECSGPASITESCNIQECPSN